MRVLLTRPAEDSQPIARALQAQGIEALVWPLTRIVPRTEHLSVPAGTEALLFTSANAVRAFANCCPERGLPVLAVGDRTARAARDAGFAAVTSARGDARDLARLARATRHRRFLYPHGRVTAGDLAGSLAAAGLEVHAPVVYAAEPSGRPPADVAQALVNGTLDVVTVWSPSNAGFFMDWCEARRPPLAATDLLGISENAVAPLRAAGFRRILVADRPNAAAMMAALLAAARR